MNNMIIKCKKYIALGLQFFLNLNVITKIYFSEKKSVGPITTIIFSKNRAVQLYALMNSLLDTKIGNCNVIVIYQATTPEHALSYEEVRKLIGDQAVFYDQNLYSSFKNCLINVLKNNQSRKIFFLVDDIIFTEKVNYRELEKIDSSRYIFSLRMGAQLRYSYVVQKSQSLPQFIQNSNKYLLWHWLNGDFEWGYPLSVDGHLFNYHEVLIWASCLKYSAPNSLEIAMQNLRPYYLFKLGACFKKSVIVNIPANKVQDEVANLHGSIHQDELLAAWQKGLCIDFKKFRGFINTSAHQEAEFSLVNKPL
ncbi:hypothetical protein G6710_02045 [Polynucleobacter paneuropaeus]|nr:hypothetical protein [Polynucleobacter paneuropaeus]